MKRYVLDRFEGDWALLEDENGNMRSVPRKKLPKESREGEVIDEKGGLFTRNPEETARRAAQNRRLLDDLFK